MSDQPPAPQRPRLSADNNGAPPRPRSRPRPAQAPQSRESRFIGYLVLGFGILAVIAVLIMAFGGKTSEQTQTVEKPAEAKDIVTDMSGAMPAETVQAPKTDLYFERDADFDAGKMEGDWQTTIGRYTAVLQMRKNVYQIILASPDPISPRFYSSGTIAVTEDIIMLNPRMDWPKPASPAGKMIAYTKLTRAPFPIIARFEGDKMLWQNVPQAEKRVIAPYTSPLFKTEDVKVATWQRLK